VKEGVWILILLVLGAACANAGSGAISMDRMRAIYEEVETPYKYGVVIRGSDGRSVDCPTVFRYQDAWYMVFVRLEKDPQMGYTTQLARSEDLLQWQPLGEILHRGEPGSWDHANAGGGIALADIQWGGDGHLGKHEGRYWLSYLGGDKFGYESMPLSIGLASTDDPGAPAAWQKVSHPVLAVGDPDVRAFETGTLYKSFVFHDQTLSLGAPFVMYYNAKPAGGNESIGMAISQDLRSWKRYGDRPVIVNQKQDTPDRGAISGDPQIVRMDDLWVMFYFGAFWEPNAFDTFAASEDLVHWTKWEGPHLVEPSEPWDETFAHKPWILKHDGVVYHFYCAVGDQGRVIALATSRPMTETKQRGPENHD
jgi:predicted GH43/DUF377 family glycosyl hydrolase